jgi:hypothetical protein
MNPKTIKATVETKAELVSCGSLVIGTTPYDIEDTTSRLQNYNTTTVGETLITGKVLADSLEINSLTPSVVNAQYTKTSQITHGSASTITFNNLATTTSPNSSVVPTTTCTTTCDVTNDTDTTTKNPPLVGLFASSLLSGSAMLQLGRDASISSILSYNIATTNYMNVGNRIEIYPTYVNFTSSSVFIGGVSSTSIVRAPTFALSSGAVNTISASASPQNGIAIPGNTREIVVSFKNVSSTACFYGIQFSYNSSFSDANLRTFTYVGNGNTNYAHNAGGPDTNKWLFPNYDWGFPLFFPVSGLATRVVSSGKMKFDFMGTNTSNQSIWRVSYLASADANSYYWNFAGTLTSSANQAATYIRWCVNNPYSGNTDTISGYYQITFF